MLTIRPEQLDALRSAVVSDFIRRVTAELRRDEVVAKVAPSVLRAAIDEERDRAPLYGFTDTAHAEEYIGMAVRWRFRDRSRLAALEAIFGRSGPNAAEKLAAARAVLAQAPR